MSASRPSDVTRLLLDLSSGRREATDELLPLVYAELRDLAARLLRNERPDHTLQPTALVHEAYLRLVDQRVGTWENRAHFLGIAAQAMRRILIDHARRRRAGKRAGARVTLDERCRARPPARRWTCSRSTRRCSSSRRSIRGRPASWSCASSAARAWRRPPRVLGVGTATVKRDWALARAWLHRALGGTPG